MNQNPPIDPGPPPTRRYLRVQELARLRDVMFAPRRPVRGLYAGRHASRQRGHCVEFNDYREYTPGDEVGDIDWKAYGRSDRLYIKLFEHQADMTVNLLIDASASMGFTGLQGAGVLGLAQPWIKWLKGSIAAQDPENPSRDDKRASKYDQACLMAGAIAFLTVRQRDRVGFAVAQGGPGQTISPKAIEPRGGFAHLDHVLRSMERVKPVGRAHLGKTLQTLGRTTARRSLLVLFTDLMEDRDAVLKALNDFTSRGNEAIVFHILHEDELRLPDMAETVFIDSETGRRVRMNVRDVRQGYHDRIARHTDEWQRALTACGIDYKLVSTGTHYHEALRDYLFTRAARA